jgi:hypothetical protein
VVPGIDPPVPEIESDVEFIVAGLVVAWESMIKLIETILDRRHITYIMSVGS